MEDDDFYELFYDEFSEQLKEYCKRISRHEKYLVEKDAIGHSNFFGSEDELYKMSIASYIMNTDDMIAEKKYLEEQIILLHKVLKKLKIEYPEEYEIIRLYYFSKPKLSMKKIGKMKNITKQSVNGKLNNAYRHLRKYIKLYKNE